MTHQEIKDYICDQGYEETIVFENPAFDSAFIGLDTNGRAVYDYDLMVEDLSREDDMTWDDAMEFIEYNTIRALPYMGEMAPIIVHAYDE